MPWFKVHLMFKVSLMASLFVIFCPWLILKAWFKLLNAFVERHNNDLFIKA
jgi:hypothetical protein